MSAPSDPEKYSIDEMMDRLKSRTTEDPIENGELVTRADGSQAIRVRKRKRRSQQPHKEERKNHRRARMLQVSAALILILLAAFLAGFAIAFANSAPFREKLVRKIALSTGAAVELEQFRMNPAAAKGSALNFKWPEGNVLRELSLRGITARISPRSFLGKAMTGQEVTGNDGTLVLRLPDAAEPARTTPAESSSPLIKFDQYSLPKFHLIVGDPAAPKLRMSNSEATFTARNLKGRPQLLLNRGEISLPGWPVLRMDRSHIEFSGDEADVIVMRLKHATDTKGEFELSGILSPYLTDKASVFSVHLENFLVSGLVGDELGRLFTGRLDTLDSPDSNYLSFTPGSSAAPVLSASFQGAGSFPFEVRIFPFLSGLGQSLDDEWFARPVFDSNITGVIRRTEGNVSIEDLNLENKGRMAVRGALEMKPNRSVTGQLEIGIAEGMIKTSGNKRLDAMFGPTRDGFRWVTLTIAGMAGSPTDNFRALYEATTPATTGAAPEGAVPSFEELTRPK